MGISAVLALEKQETEGVISTGYVDIDILPYEIDEDITVTLGEQIALVPKVKNKGAACYLRIKISYLNENTNFLDYVSGFNDKFEKHGDYYYLKEVFDSNSVIELFNQIKIPEDASQIGSDKVIELKIMAEAIQEKNFEPDYTLDNPWKDNIPTKSINDLYNIVDYSKISIGYENNTDKDIDVPNDFMERVKSSMPGDSYIETITLKDSDKKNANYYMSIGTDETDQKNINLLKRIKLTITNQNGDTLYDGSLIGDGKILIGKYNIDESDKLDFKISFPTELGNEFENLNPDWFIKFSAEYDKDESEDDSHGNTDDNTNDDKDSNDSKKNMKTGDKIDNSVVVFIISSICFIIVCVLYNKENKKIINKSKED